MCDWDPPEFYDLREPCARKEHQCYECRVKIPAGTKYVRITGKWDGTISSFKMCRDCNSLINQADCVAFGELSFWIGESVEKTPAMEAFLARTEEAV